ncbi:hypothetical protein [uncultured Corynebacterium sp.]|uniref:hypothetical protein n=1 Tax=uncultured Corynebacterium sp. TaxID=159447 RepID=UPI00262EAA49|nr:hypothetical protein [uncultured Corynebacterium sp.]
MTIKDLEKLLLAVAGAEESHRLDRPREDEEFIYGRVETATFEAVYGVRTKITRPGFEVDLFIDGRAASVEFPETVTLAEAERCIQAMVGTFMAAHAAGNGEALDD